MNIDFRLAVDLPFYKDQWGYKTRRPLDNVHYGNLDSTISTVTYPRTSKDFQEEDILLRDFLNGIPIESNVEIATRGVAGPELLNTPGALSLKYRASEFKISTKRIQFTGRFDPAPCTIKLETHIPMNPPNGNPILSTSGFEELRMLKVYLNDPDKYYYSQEKRFVLERPQTEEDLIKLYKMERCMKDPSSEEILLDPLVYINSPSKVVAKISKALISGDILGYK